MAYWMSVLLFLAACFLACAHGANDNFKGVASLFAAERQVIACRSDGRQSPPSAVPSAQYFQRKRC